MFPFNWVNFGTFFQVRSDAVRHDQRARRKDPAKSSIRIGAKSSDEIRKLTGKMLINPLDTAPGLRAPRLYVTPFGCTTSRRDFIASLWLHAVCAAVLIVFWIGFGVYLLGWG